MAAKKKTAKKTAAKATAKKTAKKPVKKTAKKVVAKPAKKAVKKAAPKKVAAKKTPAKAVAKKTSLKKVSPKKVAAKKVVAKKVVAKKVAKPVAIKSVAAKPAAPKAFTPRKGPRGLPEDLLDAALKVLDERQAEDIVTVDLAGKSSMADYLIIASGRASRQISAIAGYLREALEKLGSQQVKVEGLNDANWVLVDAGDVIIHLFRPEVRQYYDLDTIWNDNGKVRLGHSHA